MLSRAEDFIDSASRIINEKADFYHDPDREKAGFLIAEAQVHATQAVAAAVDRLAAAVENLQFTIGR